jgi:transcriptional regulator with XRE-family HTH domain
MTTTTSPPRYLWGAGAQLRAFRDYLGFTVSEMADLIDMARRSYQRIERGQDAVPPGLWDTLHLHRELFDLQVQAVILRAETTGLIEVDERDEQWQRRVAAEAAARTGVPVVYTGEHQEEEEETDDGQVPEPR